MKILLACVCLALFEASTFGFPPRGSADYTKLEEQSKRDALALFPSSGEKGTPLYGAIAAEIAAAEKDNPAAFDDPGWPIILLKKALKENPSLSSSTPGSQPPQSVPPDKMNKLKAGSFVIITRRPEQMVEDHDSGWHVDKGEVYILRSSTDSTSTLELAGRKFDVPSECIAAIKDGDNTRAVYEGEAYDLTHPIEGAPSIIFTNQDIKFVVGGQEIIIRADHSYLSSGVVDGNYVLFYKSARLYLSPKDTITPKNGYFPSPGKVGDQPPEDDLVQAYNEWKESPAQKKLAQANEQRESQKAAEDLQRQWEQLQQGLYENEQQMHQR